MWPDSSGFPWYRISLASPLCCPSTSTGTHSILSEWRLYASPFSIFDSRLYSTALSLQRVNPFGFPGLCLIMLKWWRFLSRIPAVLRVLRIDASAEGLLDDSLLLHTGHCSLVSWWLWTKSLAAAVLHCLDSAPLLFNTLVACLEWEDAWWQPAHSFDRCVERNNVSRTGSLLTTDVKMMFR